MHPKLAEAIKLLEYLRRYRAIHGVPSAFTFDNEKMMLKDEIISLVREYAAEVAPKLLNSVIAVLNEFEPPVPDQSLAKETAITTCNCPEKNERITELLQQAKESFTRIEQLESQLADAKKAPSRAMPEEWYALLAWAEQYKYDSSVSVVHKIFSVRDALGKDLLEHSERNLMNKLENSITKGSWLDDLMKIVNRLAPVPVKPPQTKAEIVAECLQLEWHPDAAGHIKRMEELCAKWEASPK